MIKEHYKLFNVYPSRINFGLLFIIPAKNLTNEADFTHEVRIIREKGLYLLKKMYKDLLIIFISTICLK